MYSELYSYTVIGVEAVLVKVEVSITQGLPKFEIIGMPDTEIRESRERIFQSIQSLDYDIPPGNITVNLSPADIRKKGTNFDLAIALGLLLASRQISTHYSLDEMIFAGELSLIGKVFAVNGIFGAAIKSLQHNMTKIIYPVVQYRELDHFNQIDRIPVNNLQDSINFLNNSSSYNKSSVIESSKTRLIQLQQNKQVDLDKKNKIDFSQVNGNEIAKVALQLSVIGRLNILLVGSPGCGKTMLLRRMPTIFPKLLRESLLEVNRIHSIAGENKGEFIQTPPFREIHHSISDVSLSGGGKVPKPGEVSLAHKGFLFLDELSEFKKSAIQILRTPIEDKKITVSRINYTYEFPSDFTLVAATNPCPCGYYGDHQYTCSCGEKMVKQYMSKLSGPILDRVDIVLYINRPEKIELFHDQSLSSDAMKENMKYAIDFLEENPDYLKEDNIQKIMQSSKDIKKIIQDSYNNDLISLRRVRSIAKTAITYSLLKKEKINADHVYTAIQLCKNKII